MRIGIVATVKNDMVGTHEDYYSWIEQFGTPVIIAPVNSIASLPSIDALVLPGGADIEQKRYSHFPSLLVNPSDPFLEHFDSVVLPKLIGKLPIFGICRGLQTLNVAMGGTLCKHLWKHPMSVSKTSMTHGVWSYGYDNKKDYPKPLFMVNSFHHQAIGRVADNISVELVAHDGTIEAISCNEKKFFGVQWHPERLLDEYSYMQFKSLLGV
jgi:putative glutamine amidotransferase